MRKRRRMPGLSYANVVATLALFVALGGSAYAIKQLPKNSVGTKQLKKTAVSTGKLKGNAVTKNKIRKNAVVTRKIRGGAVTRNKIKNSSVNGAKIADNSVTGSEINASTTPFSRIVHEARGSGPAGLAHEKPTLYPLGNNTYTQEANRDDGFTGAADVTFKPTCTPPRSAIGVILLDPGDPNEPEPSDIVGIGSTVEEAGGGEVTKRINIGAGESRGSFQRDVPVNHVLYMGIILNCSAGEGATATYGAVDVIGTK